MLLHIQNLLNSNQLADCRQLLNEEAAWIDGNASAGFTAAKVKNNQELSQAHPVAQETGKILVAAMTASQNFMASALPVRISPPSFSRYEPGQSYGMHNDAAVMDFVVSGSRVLVRTDLAATVFLSAPEEYEGGELVIHDAFGISKIKFPAGDMVLYPASSLHQVQPVTKGKRLVSFLWIQSMVRNDLERGLLRDLDVTIQQLGRSAPGNPANARLLGLYHNLLRLWCDT